MRKLPPAPRLERESPEWPPSRRKLRPHENGCLLDPKFPGLAYCPECLLSMHPSYFPKHSKEECASYKLEFVQEVMRS